MILIIVYKINMQNPILEFEWGQTKSNRNLFAVLKDVVWNAQVKKSVKQKMQGHVAIGEGAFNAIEEAEKNWWI